MSDLNGKDDRRDIQTENQFEPLHIFDFIDVVLVQCPECQAKARVSNQGKDGTRFICLHCGRAKVLAADYKGHWFTSSTSKLEPGAVVIGSCVDPYFHLPLWLQLPCGNHVVWAYNEKHLEFLREYIQSQNRTHPQVKPGASRNRLLESRLPKWMKSAKNRERILAVVDKLSSK